MFAIFTFVFCSARLTSGDLTARRRKHGQLEPVPLGTDEEVARCSGEHDAAAGRIDPLLAELDRGFAKTIVSVLEVFGEILRQGGFGRRPAVVRLAFGDPLLAVVALVPFMAAEL
jgi:hypothetical protein